MSVPPIPVVFAPLFKPKPWGGRRLAELFGKPLPPGERIGESWELVSLPGAESVVREGPLAGTPLADLVSEWGERLLGAAPCADGRFPLLVKFLDARENLSIQVHPKPTQVGVGALEPGVKHEAWYVVDADAVATVFIGLEEGVTETELATAAATTRLPALLRRWSACVGDCYFLPSGVVHALGGGLVVAEIQTPADVTYRLYDWERRPGGRPRKLHLAEALASARFDVRPDEIMQLALKAPTVYPGAERVAVCERFVIDRVTLEAGPQPVTPDEMLVWVVLRGAGRFTRDAIATDFRAGDVVLVPAEHDRLLLEIRAGCLLLEVRLPATPLV